MIRDIVFEEHEPPPTPVTELLESHGYTILGVRQGLAGPIVSAPGEAYRRQMWDPPALLASVDPERASYGSFCSFEDPDGNLWVVQEVTTRAPGRVWED